MAETEAVSVATAEAIHGCYLHGEPVDEARMRSLFTKIDRGLKGLREVADRVHR